MIALLWIMDLELGLGLKSIYDVTDALCEINRIGMDILTVDIIIKKLMSWIKKYPHHDFPKKTHKWKKLIETEYLYYFPTQHEYYTYFNRYCLKDDEGTKYWWSVTNNGRLFVRANVSKVLRKMVDMDILYPSAYGKRLKINKYVLCTRF